MVEVMKIMATSFKRSQACTAAFTAPHPAVGYQQPTPPPETPGHSRASLGQSLVGSLLLSLGPGVHGVLFVPSKSLFPQSWVRSGSSVVGLRATSSKRAMPPPALLHPEPLPLWQATADPYIRRRHSNTQRQVWLGLCGVSGGWRTRFCLSPPRVSGRYGD